MLGRYTRGGRGRGGRSYRGGQGRGRFQDNKMKSTSKELEMKFFPHGIGRERQTVTYDTVKDHIVQHVQKTYKNGQDIAVSLRNLVKKDLNPSTPTRGRATLVDPIEKINLLGGAQ